MKSLALAALVGGHESPVVNRCTTDQKEAGRTEFTGCLRCRYGFSTISDELQLVHSIARVWARQLQKLCQIGAVTGDRAR